MILSRAVSVLACGAIVLVTLIGFGLVYDFVNFLKDASQISNVLSFDLLKSSDMTMSHHKNKNRDES